MERAVGKRTGGCPSHPQGPSLRDNVVETLVEQKGDCEDSATLYAAILKNLGYDVVLLLYNIPDEKQSLGHLSVGLNVPGGTGSFELYKNKRYYYCETAFDPKNIDDDFPIGLKPQELKDGELKKVIEI